MSSAGVTGNPSFEAAKKKAFGLLGGARALSFQHFKAVLRELELELGIKEEETQQLFDLAQPDEVVLG